MSEPDERADGRHAGGADDQMPPARRPPRHAAPSPSGAYLPPPSETSQPRSPADPADLTGSVGPGDSGQAGGSEPGVAGAGPDELASPPGLSGLAAAAAGPGWASGPAPDPAGASSSEPPSAAGTSSAPDTRVSPAGPPSSPRGDALRLVWVYPDLLSTYGDRGNLLMLERRARLHGLAVESFELNSDQAVPRQGDIYLLGGGEDLPQVLAARRLQADGGLAAAARGGAVIFAVCAGYQLIGTVFSGAQGESVEGLGILDLRSGRGDRRGVGEIVADVDAELGVDRLTGFENHQGVTTLGAGVRPLARVVRGVGNGDGTEGAYAGRILGTYLHGPALVRNPGLADLLLTWAAGPLPPIAEADEAWTRKLRAERLAAVSA